MFSLFAFQSARVSVVSDGAADARPRCERPRARRPGRDAGENRGSEQQRASRALERQGDEDREAEREAARAGRFRGSRAPLPRRAARASSAPFCSATTRASSATTATSSPSRTSRFRCMSCQTRNGCSVAIVAPTTPTRERDGAAPDLEHDDRGQGGERDVRDADDEPVPLEDLVEAREEPGVERLRVARGSPGQEAERPARDERLREAVALLDELLEDRSALAREGRRGAAPPRRRARSRVARPSRHGAAARARHGRDGGVEPRALPELEHEQAPEPMAVVALAVACARASMRSTTFGCSCSRARARASRSVSPASSRSGPRNQSPSGIPNPVLPRAASSGGIRSANARRRAAFPRRPSKRRRVGQRDPELQHLVVEQRRAELERGRHRGAVCLHEQVVREVGACVEPLEAAGSAAGARPSSSQAGRGCPRRSSGPASRARRAARAGRSPSARRSVRCAGRAAASSRRAARNRVERGCRRPAGSVRRARAPRLGRRGTAPTRSAIRIAA